MLPRSEVFGSITIQRNNGSEVYGSIPGPKKTPLDLNFLIAKNQPKELKEELLGNNIWKTYLKKSYVPNYYPPLHLVIISDHKNYEIMHILLEAGAYVDQFNLLNETPLFIAAEEGDEKAIELLLRAGAKVNQANRYGETPLYIAKSKGYESAVAVLLKYGAKSWPVDGIKRISELDEKHEPIDINLLREINCYLKDIRERIFNCDFNLQTFIEMLINLWVEKEKAKNNKSLRNLRILLINLRNKLENGIKKQEERWNNPYNEMGSIGNMGRVFHVSKMQSMRPLIEKNDQYFLNTDTIFHIPRYFIAKYLKLYLCQSSNVDMLAKEWEKLLEDVQAEIQEKSPPIEKEPAKKRLENLKKLVNQLNQSSSSVNVNGTCAQSALVNFSIMRPQTVSNNSEPNGIDLLNEVVRRHFNLSGDFYHIISRDVVEQLLIDEASGAFLFRKSSQKGYIAISFKIDEKIGHALLRFDNDKWYAVDDEKKAHNPLQEYLYDLALTRPIDVSTALKYVSSDKIRRQV